MDIMAVKYRFLIDVKKGITGYLLEDSYPQDTPISSHKFPQKNGGRTLHDQVALLGVGLYS